MQASNIFVLLQHPTMKHFPWKLLKAHVMGTSENNNDSLNLQALRQQILSMQ
jgi:hypothetical protein